MFARPSRLLDVTPIDFFNVGGRGGGHVKKRVTSFIPELLTISSQYCLLLIQLSMPAY